MGSTYDTGALNIEALLRETDALGGDARLAEVARGVFEYTQFLLDEEQNLTKAGNLNGEAKAALEARVLQLLGVEQGDDEEDDDDEETSNASDAS